MHLKRASRVRGADGPAEGGQKAGGRVWMGRPRCLQNSRSSLEAVHPEEVRDRSARSLPRHGLRRTVQTSPRGSQEDCAAGISLRGTSPPAWAKGLCKLLVAALTAGRRASTLAAPSTPAAWALLGVPVGMATGVGRAGSQEEKRGCRGRDWRHMRKTSPGALGRNFAMRGLQTSQATLFCPCLSRSLA
ncbi:uncharacterized protein LOC115296251 isoform X2 [Suricata suricatta]|uniref:uncharacterized protein LOC115296251 isoform X2 n=1 Tax=Suricata suricatta TaxID=37032 RepID=UPI001155AD6C|nr:uncharacterized protein LOC115296251 isoform X2 [Suricata suricatta]